MYLLKRETKILPEQKTAIRISDIPAGTFSTIHSRKAFKKAIKNGLVTLNGQKAYTSNFVKGGECIVIFQNTSTSKKPTIDLPLKILYEDNFLAVIYKPPGIIVSGNKKYTIENALPKVLKISSENDALKRPEPIHRLDYPTSGCLLIGKTSSIVMQLNKMFETKKIEKTYHAVTIHSLSKKGSISTPLSGKESYTIFECLETITSHKYNNLNLVKLVPKTGRKHQLRKHLAIINSPILGDKDYGIEGKKGLGNGLYLHATSLTFKHPITSQKVLIETNLPKKFLKLFKNIEKQQKRLPHS